MEYNFILLVIKEFSFLFEKKLKNGRDLFVKDNLQRKV